jgi:hypothetical protein
MDRLGKGDRCADHESLGSSLHQVGYCFSGLGRFEEARASLEDAVAQKAKGDIFGRVDRESVAVSQKWVDHLKKE